MEKNLYEEGKGKYQRLYDYFANEDEGAGVKFSESELEEIIYKAQQAGQVDENIGYRHERCQHNEAEKAFQEHWQKENLPLSWLNHGYGILQDLFIESKDSLIHKRMVVQINSRDRMIVATVIQWLGSNIGWCFLEEVFKKLGYKITKIENK